MATRSRWIIAVGVGLAVLFGPGTYEVVRLKLRVRTMDARLAGLAVRQEALRQEEARLREDPVYVEGLLRSTFKYAKPDEYVIPLESAHRSSETRGAIPTTYSAH